VPVPDPEAQAKRREDAKRNFGLKG
jgi:hypothetical protein